MLHRDAVRRAFRILAETLATALVFIVALVAAIVLHLDVPAARRVVADQTSRVVSAALAGDLDIDRIGHLGLRGVSGVRARVVDPEGVEVLSVAGARARFDALDVARAVLAGKRDIVVRVDHVTIDHADVLVDGDGAGGLRLANAFTPSAAAPGPEKGRTNELPAPGAPHVRVLIAPFSVAGAWVHGRPPSAPAVDADLRDLSGDAQFGPERTHVAVEHVAVATRGLPRGLDARGALRGGLTVPSQATDKGIAADAAFEGTIARIPTTANARLDGARLDAFVSAQDASGERVREAFDELSVSEPLALHAEAHGELPRLDAQATLSVGRRGSIQIGASADLRETSHVNATLAARHADLSGLLASAPRTDIALDARGAVAIGPSGGLAGDVEVDTLASEVAGERLPPLRVSSTFTSETAHAFARVVDSRVRAELEVDVLAAGVRGRSAILEARLHAAAPDLSSLPVVGARGARVSGHAAVAAKVFARLDDDHYPIRAHVHLRGAAIARAGHDRLDDIRVLATAAGDAREPVIDVGIHATGVRSGQLHAATVDVRGAVEPRKTFVVRDAHVDVVEHGELVSANAERIVIGRFGATVERALVQGLGDPIRGDFSLRKGRAHELRASIDAPAIDLARVAALTGRTGVVRAGSAAIRGEIAMGREGAQGAVHAAVRSLSAAEVSGASGTLDAVFAGRDVGIEAHGDLGEAGRFAVATKRLAIDGDPTKPRTWTKAWGNAAFDAQLDIAKVASLFPRSAGPVGELAGELRLVGSVRRDSSDVPPEISVHGETRGLVVSGPARPREGGTIENAAVIPVPSWRSAGVDVACELRIDATSGFVSAAARAYDREGILVASDAKAYVPYASMLAAPARAFEALKASRFSAKVVVPRRALAELPPVVRTRRFGGTIAAELDVAGTFVDPRATLVARARNVHSPSGPAAIESDADLRLEYDGSVAGLSVDVRGDARARLTLLSRIEIGARELIAHGAAADWTANARVELAGFPVDSIEPVARERVHGRVSGTAVLEDLHRDAHAMAHLDFDGLRIGGVVYPKGRLGMDARDGRLVTSARLEQSDGYADVRATTDLRWGRALVPAVAPSGPFDARVEARSFRLAAVLPFTKGAFSQLDGRVDASVALRSDGTGKMGAGRIALSGGTVQLASMGPELTRVRAVAEIRPDGLIRISDIYARGVTGEVDGEATVQMDGLQLRSATAAFTVPDSRPMGLSLFGRPLGQFSGRINAEAKASPQAIAMTVDVPKLDVSIPQDVNKDVQELSKDPNIVVGVYRDANTFVRVPLDREDLHAAERESEGGGTRLDVAVHLANVEVRYGRIARAVLQGDPHVSVVGDDVKATGHVEVKYGTIEVQGKEFTIERATITFQPEQPGNPIVVATASWTAQDGTKVFADFVGPVDTGKVTLRSEPARPKNEIAALLLFGSAEGMNGPSTGTGPGVATSAAVGVGGGIATQGLTEAIDDLTGIRATARIDTSRANNPAPELEIQIARRMSVELIHVLGTPPLSRPDKNLITLDWRFSLRWSLETTFGDRGTVQTDIIWQKRY
ncbi:MAG: hypothetical protein JWP87_2476 [Labilithrix sp.]|nr:hypothetical protein [Labilithrix sp.]